MSLSIPGLSASRTVLFIGDDALYIYTSANGRLVETIPWETDQFAAAVAECIDKKCKSKPVVILNDMTDLPFKAGQRMPKVGPLDKPSVLRRKLHVAFPNYPIRGALQIKNKGPVSKADKQKGDMYLFAAVPKSDSVSLTLSAVQKSSAQIVGFFLLPVESAGMVHKLGQKISKRNQSTSKWCIFLGQHQGGALRQIITRDGILAMTRMTPVIDTDSDPNIWASEVFQELKATISYLSRYGYTPEDGTQLMVIANTPAGQALGEFIDIPCHFSSLSVQEAGGMLGLKVPATSDPRYADPLHAVWVGGKTQFVLPMDVPEIKQVAGTRKAAMAASLALLLSAGYFGYTAFNSFSAMSDIKSDIDIQTARLATAQREVQEEEKKLEVLGYDIQHIRASLSTYKQLESQSISFLPVIDKIQRNLGLNLRIDGIKVERKFVSDASGTPGNTNKKEDGKAVADARFQMIFPRTMKPEDAVKVVDELTKRLRMEMPDFTVSIEKQVADLSFQGSVEGRASELGEQGFDEQQENVAEIRIVGPVL